MKGYSYFLDTNIFFRIIVKDDRRKAAACENLIKTISEGKIKAISSSLVLAELVWTSLRVYKISKPEIIKIIQGILAIKNLKIDDRPNPLLAVEYFEKHKVKFIDCLIASHPQIKERNIKVISYDKDFDKLGIIRLEPESI